MKRLLIVSSWGLSISVLGFFASVIMAYPWASRFSLMGQIIAHISIPLWAAGVKLFYVLRLNALRSMERSLNMLAKNRVAQNNRTNNL